MILKAIEKPYSEHVRFPFKYISRKSFPFGTADVKEAFYGKSYKFVNGKCKITVPARAFLLLELPNRK